MGLISPTYISDGTQVDAVDVNSMVQTIASEFNGGIDSANIEDNSIITSKIPDSAITYPKLGTDASYAWASWTPTMTGVTVNNGVFDCKYIQIGKTVFYRFSLTFGTTTAVTGETKFSLPVTANSGYTTDQVTLGICFFSDFSTDDYEGVQILSNSGTTVAMRIWNFTGTYPNTGAISSTVPFTWTTNDKMTATGFYEAA